VGVVRVIWPISTFWGPGLIFAVYEARHFKFGLLIERKEYWQSSVNVLKFCSMGVHSCHVTS